MTGSSDDRRSLFSPFEHKTLSLRNRFCMAPMTRQKSPGGVPTDEVVKYYQRRARHGVGLIITEGTTVDHPVASLAPDVPTFHGQEALAAWKRVGIEQLEERFERGEFDLVAVGRALLQDPEWVEKVQSGRADEIRDYDAASRDVLY